MSLQLYSSNTVLSVLELLLLCINFWCKITHTHTYTHTASCRIFSLSLIFYSLKIVCAGIVFCIYNVSILELLDHFLAAKFSYVIYNNVTLNFAFLNYNLWFLYLYLIHDCFIWTLFIVMIFIFLSYDFKIKSFETQI